jgi:hypothetical protein
LHTLDSNDDREEEVSDIIENGISAIEYNILPTQNRVHAPKDGVAKWFIDELEQSWVKFTTEESGAITQHVIPADRVVEVRYAKK